jgi:regulator of PEP synthase PpsR (kinase-PPPase family)
LPGIHLGVVIRIELSSTARLPHRIYFAKEHMHGANTPIIAVDSIIISAIKQFERAGQGSSLRRKSP